MLGDSGSPKRQHVFQRACFPLSSQTASQGSGRL